ncbi:MAG TPA: glycosyltransferase family 1 protein [Bacteroidales bacterium]|nr:glycosyltransferase family 1 protein [Bacteroidales bacterium]
MKYTKNNNGRTLQKKGSEIVLNPINNLVPNKIRDLICFSHLRWDFVFQRPQHLLTRWSKDIRVFYFEEPVFSNEDNFLEIKTNTEFKNIYVLTPHLRSGYNEVQVSGILKDFVDSFIRLNQVEDYLLWYLTPMSLPFSRHLKPLMVVYDCMDELSCFKGAHPRMLQYESMLMGMADVVFTGGHSLYEYKKTKHFNIYPFPSSIDKAHFETGNKCDDPADQAGIPHPRAGFYGVIDERMDIELIRELSEKMPDFHFIMIGPVVKIDPRDLPDNPNIHYLGPKRYSELPSYLAYWDVALMPFAKNESTRFISPTKTPEYLCAYKPVISTSINDVVNPYGKNGLVHIADTADEFVSAINRAMIQKNNKNWRSRVREFLSGNSWDNTFSGMKKIIQETLERKETLHNRSHKLVSGSLPVDDTVSQELKIRIR